MYGKSRYEYLRDRELGKYNPRRAVVGVKKSRRANAAAGIKRSIPVLRKMLLRARIRIANAKARLAENKAAELARERDTVRRIKKAKTSGYIKPPGYHK